MIFRRALLLAALALIVPSSAQAVSSPTYEQVVAHSQAIAEAYWQARGVQPCGPVTVEIDATVWGGELGSGNADSCTMTLAPALRADLTAPAYICAVVTHEYGHLAGLNHSEDPNSVMYADPKTPPDACVAAWVRACSKKTARRWSQIAKRASNHAQAHRDRSRAFCRYRWRAA